jgi:hypothetical protein
VDFATALRRLIQAATRDHPYLRAYGVEVQAQHADGTVDVLPEAPDIRGLGLQHVPIMTSPAGTSARVQPGTWGLLRFADGDPRKPRIVAWAYQKGSAVVSLDGGHAGVARNGDLVELMLSASTPISGVMGGTLTSPNPVPPPPTITTPIPPTSQFTGFATIAAPVQGRIFGGAQRIKA